MPNQDGNENNSGVHWNFRRDVTVGNMVSWAAIVIGFVYGYSQLNSKVDNVLEKITQMQAKDEALQAQINVLRDLSTVRQIDISTKMIRLETILERLDGKFDMRATRQDKMDQLTIPIPRP